MLKVRMKSELLVNKHRAKGGTVTFVRINPHEPAIPAHHHNMGASLFITPLRLMQF
jgi:hypothetical protein